MIGIQMVRLSPLAAVAAIMAVFASLSPETADAQEYPWCVSRESYLYCFYKTQEQCQWTASGIGGCALNPRLLFPNKPRDSGATSARRVYFRGLPRLAKINPRASAVQRSRLANLSASLRSRPGGIRRASSKASAARMSQSSLSGERFVSLLIAPQSSRCLDLLKSSASKTLM
jgi:hypothetical protein